MTIKKVTVSYLESRMLFEYSGGGLGIRARTATPSRYAKLTIVGHRPIRMVRRATAHRMRMRKRQQEEAASLLHSAGRSSAAKTPASRQMEAISIIEFIHNQPVSSIRDVTIRNTDRSSYSRPHFHRPSDLSFSSTASIHAAFLHFMPQ
jgi:hypothetical protein